MARYLMLCIPLFFPGCTAFQTDKQMDTVRAALNDVVARMSDDGLAQFSGAVQGINPAIRVEAGAVYYAQAGYAGLAGQLAASGQGRLSRELTREERAALLRIWNDTSMSSDERFVRILSIFDGERNEPE